MGVSDSTFFGFKELGTSGASDLKAVKRWLVEVNSGGKHDVLCVGREENMGERRAKICSIKSISALGDVHLFTLGAIDLDSILTKLVV